MDEALLASIIRDTVAAEVRRQISTVQASLEAAIRAMPAPAAGKDADPLLIRQMVDEAFGRVPTPKDGKSVEPADVEAMVARHVAVAVAALPVPKDGDKGKDADPALVADALLERVTPVAKARAAEVVAELVAQIPPAAAGKDADPAEMRAEIEQQVARAVGALPAAPAGKDADPAVIRSSVAAEVARAVAALPVAQNGKDADTAAVLDAVAKAVAGLPKPPEAHAIAAEVLPIVLDAAKAQIATMQPRDGIDGTSVSLDQVLEAVRPMLAEGIADTEQRAMQALQKAIEAIPVPKDGTDGKSVTVADLQPVLDAFTARALLDFERRCTDVLQRAVDNMPKPKDGADGVSVEDFELAMKDERTLLVKLCHGDSITEREIKLAGLPIYRGPYRAGAYEKGDAMTHGGSIWLAVRDTSSAPPSDDWRLAVRGFR